MYLSGQTGNLPPNQNPSESLVEGGVGPQTTQAIKNLEAVLNAAGGNLSHVVKTTLYLKDLETNWAACQEAYVSSFANAGVQKERLPARSTIEATVPFRSAGNLVEIDAIAFIPLPDLRDSSFPE